MLSPFLYPPERLGHDYSQYRLSSRGRQALCPLPHFCPRQTGWTTPIRNTGSLREFVSLFVRAPIFPEGDKGLSVEPEGAAVLIELVKKLLQPFDIAAPHQAPSKRIAD